MAKKDGLNHAGRMRRLQAAMVAEKPIEARYNTVDGRQVSRKVRVVEMDGDTVWVQDLSLQEEPKSFKKSGFSFAERSKK